jgi:hypothetical protein
MLHSRYYEIAACEETTKVHGERWYHSGTTDQWRRVYEYTPPGYDTARETRYPVLYLQRGAGEDERGWANQGHAAFIMDNLIAERKAVPMLLVMERGYAVEPGETPAAPGPPRPAGGQSAGAPACRGFGRMFQTFDEVLSRGKGSPPSRLAKP